MVTTKQLNVLLVDDESDVTELFSFALRKHSYKFRTALSGSEALEQFERQPADILVTDIKMPGMDGFELINQVLCRYPDCQIIVISAHGDVDVAVQAMKLGAVDFLQKPVDHHMLHLAINSAAEKWSLRHELRLSCQALEKEVAKTKKAQARLEEEKELLAVTLRSIGDGVIATDLEGRLTMINKVAEKLTGWNGEEARGLPVCEVFHIINENTRKTCENPVQKVLNKGYIVGLANHTALIARDGTERSIADSAAPIRDLKSQVIGTVLVFRDVTLEKRIGDELAKTKKLESIGILAGGIAHDFNNILTGIVGNVNLAKLLIDRQHKAYSVLESADHAAHRASKLTGQLLTFAKGGAPVREVVSIYEVIKESTDFTLSGSNIVSRIDQDFDLWSADIDRGQVGQVVQNLILNAKQAMPEGGTIEIFCDNFTKTLSDDNEIPLSEGDYVKISVQDSGVGIPESVREKIFDPYFSTKQAGSGLGLAVTHSIIKKHDGHIECRAKEGGGTVFDFYLPASSQQPFVACEREELGHGSGHILLMDDEEMIREMTKNLLQHFGYDVLLAKDGEEALTLYQQAMHSANPVKLVIMDITIPGGMGGQETMKKLLEIDPEAVGIVSSGYSNDPIMADYQNYGFKGMLIKPYQLEELKRLLKDILGKEDK